jgi:hypothetical protein
LTSCLTVHLDRRFGPGRVGLVEAVLQGGDGQLERGGLFPGESRVTSSLGGALLCGLGPPVGGS